MVRRKKDQPPMKSHTIRMTDAEWAEMQRCAEKLDESDSEFIRTAIKTRIAHEDDRASIVGHYEPVRSKKISTDKETCESIKKKIDSDIKQGKVKGVRTFFKE